MLLSIGIPVLNEAQVAPLMLERSRDTLRRVTSEAFFVDVGDTDEATSIIEQTAELEAAGERLEYD